MLKINIELFVLFGVTIVFASPSTAVLYTGCYLPTNATWRSDYTYITGHGSYKLHTDKKTWNAARQTCESEKGHLAIINSEAESEIIRDFLQQNPYVQTLSDVAWIGMHNFFDIGQWVTVHDQSIEQAGYTKWHEGEPNNGGVFGPAQNCGAVNKDGRLADKKCTKEKLFICERLLFP